MQNTIYKEMGPWKIQRDPVDVIGIAWSTHNEALATWAMNLFLLRHDGHGRYRTMKEINDYKESLKGTMDCSLMGSGPVKNSSHLVSKPQ